METPQFAEESGIPIRNLWYILLYAWNETPYSQYWQLSEIEDSPSLDGLLASILAKTIQQRFRIGLGCDYISERHLFRGIRGRINFAASLKQHAFEKGQAFCEYDRFSINAPKNQIIRSTLSRLSKTGQFGPDANCAEEIRHSLRWLTRAMDGIDLIELKPDIIHQQQAVRNDHDYRIMLAICDFILQRQLPTEDAGHLYSSQLQRDRIVFHRLYERFIANFYRLHLHHWKVRPQSHLEWHADTFNTYLPNMKPDIHLQEGNDGRIVIIDTKYTAKSLITNQWGKEMFDSSHLYQIFAYLKTQEHLSDLHSQASGILLYPTIHEELSENIILQNHRISIESVNLASPWQDIEKRLLDIISS